MTSATRLWKNGAVVEDTTVFVDDGAALPTAGLVVVGLARWRADRDELRARADGVGVVIDPADGLDPLADEIAWLALVVVPFGKFSDGRGYSAARRLRDEGGFKGELRATGDVLLDQIPLMLRCGFDAFAISHPPTLRALAAGHVPAIPEVYQAAARGRTGLRFAGRSATAT